MKRLNKKSSFNRFAGWVSLEVDKTTAVSPSYAEGDDRKNTWFQKGILKLYELADATGFNNENRTWTEDRYGPGKYFGLYPEDKWYEFLEDIKANGIQYPIMIEVYTDGSKKIVEGNHRIEACKQLGIREIPAEVRYMGQSQKNYKII